MNEEKGTVRTMATALHANELRGIRADLHERFDGVVGAETVDTVLDEVAAAKAGALGFFKKMLIERDATEQLASIAAGEADCTLAQVYPLTPLAVLATAA